ncbi:hypothetical protein C3D79_17855 [Cronobacter sakazakii]|nr:hypothetical protein C3D79_17855 [Cronobacter sakazakii]
MFQNENYFVHCVIKPRKFRGFRLIIRVAKNSLEGLFRGFCFSTFIFLFHSFYAPYALRIFLRQRGISHAFVEIQT